MDLAIEEKLRRHVSKPISDEAGVVYLMVEIRKLMDVRRSAKTYPLLRLFCNWTVHTNLDHKNDEAEGLLRSFDEAIQRVKAEAGRGFSLDFLDVLSLSRFREQIRTFFRSADIPTRLTDEQVEWDTFLDLYSSVVTDCPITYTHNEMPFKHISKLTLNKKLPVDSYALSLRQEPFRVWMNWRIKLKDGTVENWPFFN